MDMSDTKESGSAIRSLVKGFASAFDLTGRTYVSIPDLSRGPERDREALSGDWVRLGFMENPLISRQS
jgi:hypothetical protein